MKDYVNWAILAPGRIANSMAQAMAEVAKTDSRVRLYAVGSRNLERSQDFARKWGFKKVYGSYEELLNDKDVDAVYVANPHAFHFESVMKCFEKGKHVVCEKPAGCNLTQLKIMVEKAKASGLFFMEALWTAFNPCVNKIHQKIEEGAIGQVKHIDSRFSFRIPFDPTNRLWDPIQAGGALLDLGIYPLYFSMLMSNFSPIVQYSSLAKFENEVDSWNSGNLLFENEITASFQSSFDVPYNQNFHEGVIYGTKGYIKCNDFFMCQKAQVYNYKETWGNEVNLIEEIDLPFLVNGYEYEVLEATDCILKGEGETKKHPLKISIELCAFMDRLRNDWGFKYPFEL